MSSERLERAEPLVDVLQLDRSRGHHVASAASRRSLIAAPPPASFEPLALPGHRVAPDPEQQGDEAEGLGQQRLAGERRLRLRRPRLTSSSSKTPIAAPASVVSLNRLMNWPTSAGMTLRSACGSTIRNVVLTGRQPERLGRLVLAAGSDWSPPRTISAT